MDVLNIITLDFETYYGGTLGFKHQTTEEYIRDKRFEVIGVSVKLNEGHAEWFSGTHAEIKQFLSTLSWNDAGLVCHNTLFDGAILNWIFGIKPKFMFDTLCMARALHGVEVGGSLASLSVRYEIGEKGNEVIAAEGKRRLDFTKEELERYGDYCINDVELTYKLFDKMFSKFAGTKREIFLKEFKLIDMTLRMFIEPVLTVDDAMLQERLDEIELEKEGLLTSLRWLLKCETNEEVRKKLASNQQFAKLLEDFGVQTPKKISPTTGKETFALAKNDEGFLALMEHEQESVQQLCSVRLNTKSTIEESRIQRFINIGKRNKGLIPIPLKYYGAHTGRWAGTDKVNFQNLPSRDKKKKALKNAICAPDGYLIVNCDSSQIEARVLAWLAGQNDVVKQFRDGEDVYSIFASKVYNRTITKADPEERFVGKTCILGLGYGTGPTKLQHTLATAKPISVKIDEEKAKEIVKLYRDENSSVKQLWSKGDKVIEDLLDWPKSTKPYYYGKNKVLKVTPEGIVLPNELLIRYPGLYKNTEETKTEYIYKSRKGPVSIWGGALVENVVQALARIVVGEQMLIIQARYRVALTVHDAAVCVVPEDEADEAVKFIVDCMSSPPDWAAGLPVACEAKIANSYGAC